MREAIPPQTENTPETPETKHFAERSGHRSLPEAVKEFILSYGSEFRRRGMTHLTIIEKKLPPALRASALAERALGWILLMSDDFHLITCYRRRDALRYLRKKSKRQRPVS
jgi:hypothetical protein